VFKRDTNGRLLVEKRNDNQYRIPIFGKNASRALTDNADYGWLLQLRAQQGPYAEMDAVLLENALIHLPSTFPKQ
jgi:hypothetical protein